jgi:hypothetical protein
MTGATGSRLLMKLTVAADEMPELYQALVDVTNARRRASRLKNLAARGLVVERTGSTPMAPASRALPGDGATRPSTMPEGFSGAEFAHGLE